MLSLYLNDINPHGHAKAARASLIEFLMAMIGPEGGHERATNAP